MIRTNTSRSVLVVGESLMDVVEAADVHSRHPGGSPMNVAYGLGRLGVRTSLLTAVGRDEDGDAIVAHVESAGVTVLPASRTDWKTGTAEVTLDESGAAGYRFDAHWDISAPADIAPPDLLHFGSVASFLEPGASKIEALADSVRGESVVTFDPNIRPALLGDRDEVSSRFERLARLADVVKLSDEDANWLYPAESAEDVLTRVLASGPRLAIMTLGSRGALLASEAARVEVPAVLVTVQDTIGAGDSYMSAVISRILAPGWRNAEPPGSPELRDLGEWAARVSSITVTRAGAAPPSLAEVSAPNPAGRGGA